jgi:Flp pilus assembly protein TadG
MRRSGRRQRGRRGAEVLEAALIIVPLFGILFLLLDLSMVIFIRSTFQHAVREGVRYAITGANDTGPCQDDSIKAVVKKSALGFLNSTTASAQIHVHFQNPVSGAVSDNQYGNIVQVSVEGYKFTALAPFQRLNQNPLVWARAYDMMEAVPGGLPCITKSE